MGKIFLKGSIFGQSLLKSSRLPFEKGLRKRKQASDWKQSRPITTCKELHAKIKRINFRMMGQRTRKQGDVVDLSMVELKKIRVNYKWKSINGCWAKGVLYKEQQHIILPVNE